MSVLQKGFSLIELMIVISIIGVLAAIALPAYHTYAIRAKVTEAFMAASSARGAVAEAYAGGVEMLASPASMGVKTQSSTYVTSVDWIGDGENLGVIIVSLSSDPGLGQASGQILTFSAIGTPSNGVVSFYCSSPSIQAKYLPESCEPGSPVIPIL